ncbi:MAG: aminoglycoside phosphotransferase family protein, partial [Oscillospiraceae bacterium]
MKLERVIAVRTSKTIYHDGDRVVKVFDEDYSKSGILNEALNHARVEETGLPVPELIEVTKADGKWALVTQYIPGKTLEQLMAENPGQYEHYMEQFVHIQMQMHEKQCPLLTELRDRMHRKISQTGLDATTRYDLDVRLDSMPTSSGLCHGDFNPSNIVISEADGTPYILDWSHA